MALISALKASILFPIVCLIPMANGNILNGMAKQEKTSAR